LLFVCLFTFDFSSLPVDVDESHGRHLVIGNGHQKPLGSDVIVSDKLTDPTQYISTR